MTWRTVASSGVVVGLCGGALVAGTVWQANAPTTVASADVTTRDFLRSAQMACPAMVTPDDDTVVSAASIPGTPGQDVPGSVDVTTGKGKVLTSINKPGATAVADQMTPDSGAVVTADGGLAPGLVPSIVTADPRGEGQGLSSAPCRSGSAESWLVGGGAAAGQRSVLLLVNPTESDSLVDVTAFGKGGQLEATGDDGVTVPAGETVQIRLDALVPDTQAVALRVRTRVGLISAAVVDERMNGLTPMGTDLITDAGPPQRTVVLAGMPAGAGTRELHLMATQEAGTVRITALTENGPLPLLAGEPVPVKAGSLTVLDLTDELGGRAAAIRITGDAKVVAAAMGTTAVDESIKTKRAAAVEAAERALKEAKGDAERSQAQADLAKAETANAIEPAEDFAWFGPAPDIQATAAVTGLDADLDDTLLLTGSGGAATVQVSLLAADQSGATPGRPKTVEIAGNTTVAVPLTAPRGADRYTTIVTRTAGPGEVHVGHVQLDDGRSVTGYAVSPLQVWISSTQAQPDYAP